MPNYWIPLPISTGGWHATECHPLADGGMRCEPAVSAWMCGFGIAVVIAIIIAIIWAVWDIRRERAHDQKLRDVFKRWETARTQKGRDDV